MIECREIRNANGCLVVTLEIESGVLNKCRYAEGNEAIQLSLSAADLAGVISIAESAFSGCSSLFSTMIPNSVTSIKSRTFSHCTSLVSIVIPNSVTSIYKDLK